MDSASPDLQPFQQADGKLLVWHGLADQLILALRPICGRGYDSVEGLRADLHGRSFICLFLASSVDHCGYSQSSELF